MPPYQESPLDKRSMRRGHPHTAEDWMDSSLAADEVQRLEDRELVVKQRMAGSQKEIETLTEILRTGPARLKQLQKSLTDDERKLGSIAEHKIRAKQLLAGAKLIDEQNKMARKVAELQRELERMKRGEPPIVVTEKTRENPRTSILDQHYGD